MSLDLVVKSALRDVVREEIRAALAELKLTAADQFMTYQEAADFVGCSVSTITEWIRAKALPTYGRERTIRVLRSEVMAAMTRAPTVEAESDDDFAARKLAKRGK